MEDWRWVGLSAAVKIFFAVGVTTLKKEDFGLGGAEFWKDAEDAARVAANRGLLASLPILLVLSSLAKTDALCQPHGPATLRLMGAAVGIVFIAWGFLKVPARFLKGWLTAWLIVVALTAIEATYTMWGVEPAAKLLCVDPTKAATYSTGNDVKSPKAPTGLDHN
jgi:hypothetical protein